MSIEYNIWAHVERHDTETDEYEDITYPVKVCVLNDENLALETAEGLPLNPVTAAQLAEDMRILRETTDALKHADLRLNEIPHRYIDTDFKKIREALKQANRRLGIEPGNKEEV